MDYGAVTKESTHFSPTGQERSDDNSENMIDEGGEQSRSPKPPSPKETRRASTFAHDSFSDDRGIIALSIKEDLYSDVALDASCTENENIRTVDLESWSANEARRQSQVDESQNPREKIGTDAEARCSEEVVGKKTGSWFQGPERDSFIFALRIGLLFAISMLFTLVLNWPESSWILITTFLVSWFPDLDIGSVVHKFIARIVGTLIGCAVGLILGFISLQIPTESGQRFFIAFSVVCAAFFVPLAYMECRHRFGIWGYPWTLALFSMGIALFPFTSPATSASVVGTTHDDSSSSRPVWFMGAFRSLKIVIGCVLSLLVNLSVFPRSTREVLRERVSRQIHLTAQAVDAVLQSATQLGLVEDHSSLHQQPRLATVVEARVHPRRRRDRAARHTAEDEGYVPVYDMYTMAVRNNRGLGKFFDLLNFDILHKCFCRRSQEHPNRQGDDGTEGRSFRVEAALALERCSRIQATVIMFDSLIRTTFASDPGNNLQLSFTPERAKKIANVGNVITDLLRFNKCDEARKDGDDGKFDGKEEVIKELVEALRWVRREKKNAYRTPAEDQTAHGHADISREEWVHVLADDRGPVQLTSVTDVQGPYRFCLGFAERLIVRSIRLYHGWKQFA